MLQQLNHSKYRISLFHSYRAEFYRLSTTRFTLITSLVLVVLSTLFISIAASKSEAPIPFASVSIMWKLPTLLFLIIGAGAITSEYSQNTIRTSVLAIPRRGQLFLSKLLALLSYTALLSILFMSICVLILQISDNTLDTLGDKDTWLIYLRTLILYLAASALGLGIGYTLRSTAGSITLGFVITELLGILTLIPKPFFREVLANYIFEYLGNTTTAAAFDVLGMQVEEYFTPWQALGVLWIYPLVFLLIGAYRFMRSDV